MSLTPCCRDEVLKRQVLSLLKTILSFTAVHDQLYTNTYASVGREPGAVLARAAGELKNLRAAFHESAAGDLPPGSSAAAHY